MLTHLQVAALETRKHALVREIPHDAADEAEDQGRAHGSDDGGDDQYGQNEVAYRGPKPGTVSDVVRGVYLTATNPSQLRKSKDRSRFTRRAASRPDALRR